MRSDFFLFPAKRNERKGSRNPFLMRSDFFHNMVENGELVSVSQSLLNEVWFLSSLTSSSTKIKAGRNPFLMRSDFFPGRRRYNQMTALSQSLLNEVWFLSRRKQPRPSRWCRNPFLMRSDFFPNGQQVTCPRLSRNPFLMRSDFFPIEIRTQEELDKVAIPS